MEQPRSYLIAEFGNCHFGSMDHAKELIRAACDSGATLAKGQAFRARDITGSMPKEFYQLCEFTLQQYIELIEYGRDIGIPVFFSVFSKELRLLEEHMDYYKLSGGQTKSATHDFREYDISNAFISIPKDAIYPFLKRAQPLYVCEYLAEDPELQNVRRMADFYKRPVGYSDHTVGLDACKRVLDAYAVPVIEKHFTIQKDYVFSKAIFRDCVHGSTPKEFSELAKYFNSAQSGFH